MKNSMKCPKCDNLNIIVAPGWTGSNKSGQYIRMPGFHLVSANIKIDRHICSNCGYIEEWVPSEKDLEKINEKMGNS